MENQLNTKAIESLKNQEPFKRKADAKKVFIKLGYNRELKAYECQDNSDISNFIYIKKGKQVFINFEF